MDGEAAGGERVGDRIDQEGHVVVDDADPHPAMAERAAERLDPDEGDAGRPAGGAGGDELGGGDPVGVGELGELAGKGAVDERVGEGVDDLARRRRGLRRRVAAAASPGSGFGSSDSVRGHNWLPKGRRRGAVGMVARPMPPAAWRGNPLGRARLAGIEAVAGPERRR